MMNTRSYPPLARNLPDLVTVTTGITGTLALYFYFNRDIDNAVRMLVASLLLDVVDGYLARRIGTSGPRGELLDRLFDRYYQVIVPAIMYADSMEWELWPTLYAAMIITIALWRLTRRVHARKYFAGAPLFLHTLLIITSLYIKEPAPTPLMILLALMSLIPLKYYRRSRRASDKDNRGTLAEARMAVLVLLMLIPYSKVVPLLMAIHYVALTYGMTGWLYFLVAERGSLKERILYTEKVEAYKI